MAEGKGEGYISKEDQIAQRWMGIRGIHRPNVHESSTHAPNPELLSEAYDLIVQKDDLNSDRVREQRSKMDPDKKDTPLSLEEKRDMIRGGRGGSLVSSITKPEGTQQEIVGRSIEKVQEVENRLDEIFSKPDMYEAFRSDLSHQVRVRREAREVKNLSKLTDQLNLIGTRLTRDAQVEGRSLTSVEEEVVAENSALSAEAKERQRELLGNPEVFDRVRILELQEYQRQLKKQHFGETPSRRAYIDKVQGYWAEGKKVFLTGETGTGKTELIKHASQRLFGVAPEGVTGHQDMSIYELLGKTGFKTDTGDVFRPAPMIRAMTGRDGKGMPFLFDEIDRAPNQAVMGIKTILNSRPGETGIKVQTDSEGSFDVGKDYAVSATGNIKSDKHTTATDLDPAIVRVFDAPMDVDYMPSHEVYDLALASLMDKRGGAPLSEKDAKETLKHLVDAASDIQNIYQGRKLSNGRNLDARGGATTGGHGSLKKALLDPGRTLDMLSGWQQARSKGEGFEEYLNERIVEFINNRTYPEDDRYYLTEIFALKGFLKGHKANELLVSGLDQRTLESWGARGKPEKEDAKGYLSAERVAKLDPYKRLKRPVEQDAQGLLDTPPPGGEEGKEAVSELQAREQEYWSNFLGADVEVPELPADIDPQAIENLSEDPENMGIRALPKLDIGTLQELKSMGIEAFLARIQQKYPGLHTYESLSDAEKQNPSVGRLPEKWYWEQVKAGNTAFPEEYNNGGWLAVELMPKPAPGTPYERTMISDELGHVDRFNTSWNTANQDIASNKPAVLAKLDMPSDREVRMLKAAEYSLLANREGWGSTNSYDWLEDKIRVSGDSSRLIAGRSDRGGAADVRWAYPAHPIPASAGVLRWFFEFEPLHFLSF